MFPSTWKPLPPSKASKPRNAFPALSSVSIGPFHWKYRPFTSSTASSLSAGSRESRGLRALGAALTWYRRQETTCACSRGTQQGYETGKSVTDSAWLYQQFVLHG